MPGSSSQMTSCSSSETASTTSAAPYTASSRSRTASASAALAGVAEQLGLARHPAEVQVDGVDDDTGARRSRAEHRHESLGDVPEAHDRARELSCGEICEARAAVRAVRLDPLPCEQRERVVVARRAEREQHGLAVEPDERPQQLERSRVARGARRRRNIRVAHEHLGRHPARRPDARAHRASGVLGSQRDGRRSDRDRLGAAQTGDADDLAERSGSVDPRLERSGRLDDRGERCIGVTSTG